MNQNETMFAAAQAVIPDGVDSPVRTYDAAGDTPSLVTRAKGTRVWDTDNKGYVDLVCSWGSMLLGHTDARTVAAVQKTTTRGLSFGAPTEAETLLAKAVRRRVSLVEEIRFVSIGTKTTMTAIRLARGTTGRDLVIKFVGNYHGYSDGLLFETGSGVVAGGLPASAGVPRAIAELTIVLPYSGVTALRECFTAYGDAIVGTIVEDTATNMGIAALQGDSLSEIARLCYENDALMIQNEVLSKFRVSVSGWWGLSTGREVSCQPGVQNPSVVFGTGWAPDLLTFGEVIGGGMSPATLGERMELMEQLAPAGPAYQAEILPGNPLSCVAGLVTLQAADQQVYAVVNRVTDTVAGALHEVLAWEGMPRSIGQAGSLLSVFFNESLVMGYAGAKRQEAWWFAPMFQEFHRQGVMLPPSVFEIWFVPAAYLGDDTVMNQILDTAPAATHAVTAVTSPKKQAYKPR